MAERRRVLRPYWCALGGLYVVVTAANLDRARAEAFRLFRRAGHPRARLADVRARRATPTDLARWAELKAQEARIAAEIEATKAEAQPSMF